MKHVIRSFVICLGVLMIASCTEPAVDTSQSDAPLNIEYVHEHLTDDGCSEAYTFDSVPMEKKRFIFTSNVMSNANIRVDGREIYLTRDNSDTAETWKAGEWTVKISAQAVKQTCDECSYNKGTIIITFKDKKKVIRVHGEDGC